MSTITAQAPWWKRAQYAAVSLLFLAFLVASEWVFLTDQSVKHRVAAVIIFGVFWGAWLVLALWGLAAAWASYQADETELIRFGWRGHSSIRWDEIDHYLIRKSPIYLFYDHQGCRRTSIDFQLLAEGGEPLFELLMRKLPQVLPDQEHPRPILPHLSWRERLPQDPEARARVCHEWAGTCQRCAIYIVIAGLGLGGLIVWFRRAGLTPQFRGGTLGYVLAVVAVVLLFLGFAAACLFERARTLRRLRALEQEESQKPSR